MKTFKSGGFSTRSTGSIMFIDMEAAIKTADKNEFQPVIPVNKIPLMPWSSWGTNNLFPQQMTQDIETTGILNSIIDGKARFALCEGPVPAIMERDDKGAKVIKQFINDAEINEFTDSNNLFHQCYGWMRDQIGMANGVARYLLNKGRNKIVGLAHHDVTEMRLEKKDGAGKINNIWLSADWQQVRGAKDTRNAFTIPLLKPNNPTLDLQNRKHQSREFSLVFKYPGWGKHYYSAPLWYAAHKWVKIAQGVPEMKSAMFENSMVLKYMVVINEGFWVKRFGDSWNDLTEVAQEKKRNDLYDEIDSFLVGSHNAHKSVFVNGYFDKVTGKTWQDIEIKPLDGQSAQGELLPDSAAANSEIAFALLFNPAIIGASMPSGPYSNSQGGSNVRESVLLQVILHELERQNIQRIMNVVKYFNGWDKKFPGLEFVIPANVLTTLDTGASTKPVTLSAN
jgi:hypothetical protein